MSNDESNEHAAQCRRLRRLRPWFTISTLLLCMLTACKPATPEEKIEAYNRKLGAQGELTMTHLIIRWPAGPSPAKSLNPVTLEIPRAYLNDPPVAKDGKGDLFRLYVEFAFPGVIPWERLPFPPKDAPPEKIEAFRKHQSSRVLVVIDRDSKAGNSYRGTVRRAKDSESFLADGEVAGLERYSSLKCFKPPSAQFLSEPLRKRDEWTRDLQIRSYQEGQEYLKGKESDDLSPSGCRLDRTSGIFVSSPAVTSDSEGVAIVCHMGSCDAHFSAGHRGAEVHLRIEDVPKWQERVEPARKLIDGFVVDNSARR